MIYTQKARNKKLAEEAQQNQSTPNEQPVAEPSVEEKPVSPAAPSATPEVSAQNINQADQSTTSK